MYWWRGLHTLSERGQVSLCHDSSCSKNSLWEAEESGIPGIVCNSLDYCNSISAILGSCDWLGSSCSQISKSMAERPTYPWPQMDLLFIHGKQRMKYLFLSIGCGCYLLFCLQALWLKIISNMLWQVLNAILRLAWLQSLTQFQIGPPQMDTYITDFVFACLEIIRRGHWNFYRLSDFLILSCIFPWCSTYFSFLLSVTQKVVYQLCSTLVLVTDWRMSIWTMLDIIVPSRPYPCHLRN